MTPVEATPSQGKTHAQAIRTTEEASALALQIVDVACQTVQEQDGQLRAGSSPPRWSPQR